MNKYLDDNGLLYLWGKIKTLVSGVEQVQSDWNQSSSSAKDYIKNKPTLFSGSYNDLSDKPTIPTTASEVGAVATTDKGSANGVATLDSSGKVPSSQLPSYVDDVIEVYGISGTTALTSGWLSTTSNGSAITPETGKIYVLMADFPSTNPVYSTNSQFRWSGSSYVQIYDSGASAITNAEIDTIVAS